MNTAASANAASFRTRLFEFAERRLPALTRYKRVEVLPIRLDRRRIYVLPTRFGLMLSALLLVMLLGALNYNNNPALLLTCLFAATAYQSVFAAFAALNRLQVNGLRAKPCHAGEMLELEFHFDIAARPRRSLHLHGEDARADFDLATGDGVCLRIPAPQRGWLRPGRLRLSSQYPFGLFEVWSWLNPDFAALVYPRRENHPPPLPRLAAHARQPADRGGDELATLREYQSGDPPRNIAWKASARRGELLVKEFERPRGGEVVLDYAAQRGLAHEARLSRLAAWVYLAEATRQPYRLLLPDALVEAGLGAEHRHACLRALALAPGGAP
ncbi:MAG: DUF58 domain-containing protein [Proteobacteria bacterium]|nr:DUF58 domain-containing protein [Pseudomonadota bacterium]